MARHRSRRANQLSPLLLRLIEAAKRSGKDGEGADIFGVPEVLRQFGELALWAIPIYGVFLPNHDEVTSLAARVSRGHLGMEEARREFQNALKVISEFHQRDPIETAVNHVLSVSDEAYFYAGLAFGITLAERYSARG